MVKSANEYKGSSRRQALGGALALGATLAAPPIVRAQTKTIVTTGFGGIYEERFRRNVLAPFEAKTGAKFVYKYGSPDEWLTNSIINRQDPEIDLPFLSLPVAMKALSIRGLFLPLSTDALPSLKDVDPAFYDAYDRMAVAFNYVDAGIAYRPDMVSKVPTGWADLWDPGYKNQLMLSDVAGGFAYEIIAIAALLNGGNETNLEPGFAALKRLKPNINRWYKSPNEIATALERKEAAVAMSGSFRTYAIKDSGVPVEYVIPKEGAPVGMLSFHVPVNAKNRDLLLEFVNFACSPGPQAGFGNDMQSGMSNSKVVLKPEVAARVTPVNRLLRLDWKVIAPKMAQIVDRFQREIIAS
ncbi:MAG: ABC transporter substrate-binding protein [Hyphomicrobiales bacterium]|nr:ABC transporter substrate-binding protein [Hyphomicrobiales bacterium]